MARFIVRVELHEEKDGSKPNYDTLHAEMAKLGFRRTTDRDGKNYELPSGMYEFTLLDEIESVTTLAQIAAKEAWPGPLPSILVVKSNGRDWSGLKVVAPATKKG